MVTTGTFTCAFCGQSNDTEVDPSAGLHQRYGEDCQICCRPNLLDVMFTVDREGVNIDAHAENE